VIYIREAHPADSPRAKPEWADVNDPVTLAERVKVAKEAAAKLDMDIPFAVDDMQDAAALAYAAHPDRLYIVGKDGKIAYQGGKGPRGFKVDEMTERLEELLATKDAPE
jgi:iodothyronine deiodinase-like protein